MCGNIATVNNCNTNLFKKEYHIMPISSQAMKMEGPETITSVSRVKADPKRPAPSNWGDDIVQSSWKREAALKALVSNMSISDDGCWEWNGAKTKGYGTLKLREIYGEFKLLAHRLSWVSFKGESIKDGLFVCHKCDNPKCFNPDHLFLGTSEDNMKDCSEKGRTMTGENNGNSKYKKEDILRVQEMLVAGVTGKKIHEITGVSRSHISRIGKGYTWKHETEEGATKVHHNRKFADEQLMKVAELIYDGVLSNSEIAKISGTNRYLVIDMRSGKSHQRFMERVAK